jgi:MFS transporter, PPP family, 3-phenylpropionic acid transporter
MDPRVKPAGDAYPGSTANVEPRFTTGVSSPKTRDQPLYRLSPLARFVILYAALYCAFGVVSPFLPAYFADRGLTPQQIAFVIGLGTAVRLASGPLVGRLADRQRSWHGALSVCAAGAAAMALAYLPAGSFGPILLVGVMQSAFLAPLAPIADAMALSASLPIAGKGFEYGWVRGGGSAAFVVGSLAAGQAAASAGLAVSIWLNAVLLAVAALVALSVPNISFGAISFGSERARGFLRLLQMRTFRRLLLVGALVLGSHALHDTFAVIRWRDAGISTATASLLWSEQVIAEVVVFLLVGPHLLRRLGPAHAAMLSAGAGVVRWSVLGATTQIVPLALVEPLHGLTFALFHLAAMRLIGTTVPRNLAATAQALYGTVAIGSSTALLILASGSLYGWPGGEAFWVMAVLCAAAIPLARRMTG